MWLALLSEEIFLQLGFRVAQEFDIVSFWVEEQVAWVEMLLDQYARPVVTGDAGYRL